MFQIFPSTQTEQNLGHFRAYNRFRYYSPDLGFYGAQEPLGLSLNLGWAQGYVTHPGCMVDVLGLHTHPVDEAIGNKGSFQYANESMSAQAAKYQSQVTGTPNGLVYKVDGVKFDGYSNGILQEAKGPGYGNFVSKDGEFYDWFRGKDAIVSQGERQTAAANGTPIEWHVAEQEAVSPIKDLFTANNIEGINVIHTPYK